MSVGELFDGREIAGEGGNWREKSMRIRGFQRRGAAILSGPKDGKSDELFDGDGRVANYLK